RPRQKRDGLEVRPTIPPSLGCDWPRPLPSRIDSPLPSPLPHEGRAESATHRDEVRAFSARRGAELADPSPFGRATGATDGDGVRARIASALPRSQGRRASGPLLVSRLTIVEPGDSPGRTRVRPPRSHSRHGRSPLHPPPPVG